MANCFSTKEFAPTVPKRKLPPFITATASLPEDRATDTFSDGKTELFFASTLKVLSLPAVIIPGPLTETSMSALLSETTNDTRLDLMKWLLPKLSVYESTAGGMPI